MQDQFLATSQCVPRHVQRRHEVAAQRCGYITLLPLLKASRRGAPTLSALPWDRFLCVQPSWRRHPLGQVQVRAAGGEVDHEGQVQRGGLGQGVQGAILAQRALPGHGEAEGSAS